MKAETQTQSSYEIAIDRVFFGRPYHVTMRFSPVPSDIHQAQLEGEAVAKKMLRDAMVGRNVWP